MSAQDAGSEEADAKTSDYRDEVLKRLAEIEAKLDSQNLADDVADRSGSRVARPRRRVCNVCSKVDFNG